jgi:NAD(P)-dependent dehydrogenase (short-subunit alcohol dehydrogenase family)
MNQQVALVTGANRGIGLEVCRQLGKKGISIILSSRNAELGQLATERLQSEGYSVKFCKLDVADSISVALAFEWVKAEFGKLDILINNAGIAIDSQQDKANPEQFTSIFTASIDTIRMTLETNTYGPIRMIQKFVPLMKLQNFGRIVNISSGMGQLSEMNSGWPAYRISKTALNAVTRIVSDELLHTNILVNSVCPGWVRTEMGGADAELSLEEGADTIVWLATLPDGSPSGGFFRNRKKIDW